ncbi:chromate resistance protein ChrB domain-containing protein [Spirosoma gilvum]
MKWITRERPKIDRIACPWLIRRFIDTDAEFVFVPDVEVLEKAAVLQAIPFDVPNTEFSHYGRQCTFDYFLAKYKLTDPALHAMAPIIRGADTDDHSIAPQVAGLWAISAGLAFNHKNDHELLEQGMILYNALYSWAKHLQHERHTQNPTEHALLDVFNSYIKTKKGKTGKVPAWITELEELIQDHIDTNLTVSLKGISEAVQLNPTYVSREFANYFDNLSFGEYIRKLRIEKAIHLLGSSSHNLSEIAYLTGFSDQSHFTRIFKKHTGKNPSDYRKSLGKGKEDTNR